MGHDAIKPAHTSHVQVNTKDTPLPGKGAVARGTTPAAAQTKPALPLDKALNDLQLTDDHQAPVAQAPALQGIRAPGPPRKTKATTLNAFQRAVAHDAVKSAGQTQRAAAMADVQPHEISDFKEPSVFEFADEHGESQRWIMSPTLRQGSYGKFRIAMLDTPAGETPVLRAVKEFRLEERQDQELDNPSYNRRSAAWHALDELAEANPHLPRLLKNIKHLQKTLSDFDTPFSFDSYVDQLKIIVVEAQKHGEPMNDDQQRRLSFDAKTAYIAPEKIGTENALYSLVDSPLSVEASVTRDGRAYNFSKLMRGELYDVIAADGSKADRLTVARAAAREGVKRLADMHRAGLVHRDIKPENLFIDDSGDVQLGDWGFAAQLVDGKISGRLGTPGYIAPEIYSKQPYGKEVDVYALGQSLAFASSGAPLLKADDDDVKYGDGQGGVILAEQEALSLVIETLRFKPNGAIESRSLDLADAMARARVPRFKNATVTTAMRAHVGRLIGRIKAWDGRDARLCGTVLNHMLRKDPARRKTAEELVPIFTELQPEESPAAQGARAVAKDRLAKALPIDAEVTVLKAYAEAYHSRS